MTKLTPARAPSPSPSLTEQVWRRLGRGYFAVQAFAGAVWWVSVFAFEPVRLATLGRFDPVLVAVFDVPFFVLASAFVAAVLMRFGRMPGEYLLIGPFAFRTAPSGRSLAWVEQRWGLRFEPGPLSRSGSILAGTAAMISASALGLWSAAAMTARGRGTPLLWNWAIRPIEEADLEARFGARFVDYRQRVSCWVPRFRRRP